MKIKKSINRILSFALAAMIAGSAMCMPVFAEETPTQETVAEEVVETPTDENAEETPNGEEAQGDATLSDKMRDAAKSDAVQEIIDVMEEVGPVSQNEDGTINVTVTEEDKEKVQNILEIVCEAIAEFLTMLLEAFANVFNEMIKEDTEVVAQ